MKNKYIRLFFTLSFLLAFVSFAKAQCNINSFTLTAVNGTCAQDTKVNVSIAGGVTCDNATATIRLQGTTSDIDFKPLTASGNATFDNLKPGTYQVRIQQAASTTAYKNVTTTSTYKPIVVTATSENTSCGNTDPLFTNNGKVTVNFSGGNGPFTVTLAGPGGPYTFTTATAASHTFSNLAPGNYTATVTDNSATCTSAEARSVTIAETNRVPLTVYTRRRLITEACERILEMSLDNGNTQYSRQPGNATYQIEGDPTVYPLIISPESSVRTTFRTGALPINVNVTMTVTDGCNTIVETMPVRDIAKTFVFSHNISTGADCKPIYTINFRLFDLINNIGYWNLSPNSKVRVYKEVPADSNNWVFVEELLDSKFWIIRNNYGYTSTDFNTRFKYEAIDANGCNNYERIIDARTAQNLDPLAQARIDSVPSVLDGSVAFTITKNGGRWAVSDQLAFPITISIERTDGQKNVSINPTNPLSLAGTYVAKFPYSVTVNPDQWSYNQPTFSDLPPGEYKITLTNNCGQVQTRIVTLDMIATYKPVLKTVQGCANSDIVYDMGGTNVLNEAYVRLRANNGGVMGAVIRDQNENPSYLLNGQFSTVPPGNYFVEFTRINNISTLNNPSIANSINSTWSVARDFMGKNFSYYAPITVNPYKQMSFTTVSVFCDPANTNSGILGIQTSGIPVGFINYDVWKAGANTSTDAPMYSYHTTNLTEMSHIFTNVAAGTYIVRVSNQCGFTEQTVNVQPGPATFPDPVGVPDKICNVGDSTVLAMALPSSLFDITWKDNTTGTVVGTGSSITVTPLVTTTYKVEYVLKSSFGCSQPYSGSGLVTVEVGNCFCYKPATTTGTALDTKHGITALSRAGTQGDNWPMVRKGAWTVLEAKTKGFVPNRIATTALVQAIPNPVEGMMVYDEQAACLKIYTSSDNGVTFSWKCFDKQTCPDY